MTTHRLPRAIPCLFLTALAACGYFDPLQPPDPEPSDKSITWQALLGGPGEDVACNVQETSDGGFILVGYTDSFGAGLADAWLVKTDASGVEEWSKTFGGTDEDWGACLQRTADGGYVLVGTTRSLGAGEEDVYLVKTDGSGELEWSSTFGGVEGDEGYCVQCTSDGGYIVSGLSHSFSEWSEIYLIKTNGGGLEQWSKTFGGSFGDCGYCVRQTDDDGYVVAGLSQSETGSVPSNIVDDAYLLKTDADGIEEWSNRFGREYPDAGTCVELTADGGYILAGYTRSYGAGDFNGWLIKTDAEGNEQWNRPYGENTWDRFEGVQQTPDGGFILVGMSRSWGPEGQAWLVKTDSVGDEEWSKFFVGNGDDWGLSVQQTSDEGYILAGKTSSYGSGDFDAYLVYYKP